MWSRGQEIPLLPLLERAHQTALDEGFDHDVGRRTADGGLRGDHLGGRGAQLKTREVHLRLVLGQADLLQFLRQVFAHKVSAP